MIECNGTRLFKRDWSQCDFEVCFVVSSCQNQRAIEAKWVYKIKHKACRLLEKFKTRPGAKGFKQKYEIDYTETFLPVVNYATLRVVIAITKYFTWPSIAQT